MSIADQFKPAEDHGLALAAIQIDGGTQSRASVNEQVVGEYAEAIKAGAAFPPIVVFYDGKKHWLADGFHRFHAYQKAGKAKVAADIRQGTRRDAILHSVGANEAHGLRRTNDDKRRAVLTLLNDKEWAKWSDGEIAKRCAVSREYVNRLRPKDTCDQVTGMERTFVHPKTGEPTTMKMTLGKTEVQTNAPEGPQLNDEPSPEAGPQAEASPVGTDAGMPADREGRRDGEAASVGLPTSSRIILDELVALWCEAGQEDRDGFIAYLRILGFRIESPSTDGAAVAANTGGDHEVDPQPSSYPTAGAVLDKALAPAPSAGANDAAGEPVSKSDDPAARPEPAANSAGHVDTPAPDGSSDSADDDAIGAVNARSGLPDANGVEPSSPAPFTNPRCQKPDTCKWAHSMASCSPCNDAWARARVAI